MGTRKETSDKFAKVIRKVNTLGENACNALLETAVTRIQNVLYECETSDYGKISYINEISERAEDDALTIRLDVREAVEAIRALSPHIKG